MSQSNAITENSHDGERGNKTSLVSREVKDKEDGFYDVIEICEPNLIQNP